MQMTESTLKELLDTNSAMLSLYGEKDTFAPDTLMLWQGNVNVCQTLLQHKAWKDEYSQHGNRIERTHDYRPEALDHLIAEVCTWDKGWEPHPTDQEINVYRMWKHPATLRIMIYAEGDITTIHCRNHESYMDELPPIPREYWKSRTQYRDLYA